MGPWALTWEIVQHPSGNRPHRPFFGGGKPVPLCLPSLRPCDAAVIETRLRAPAKGTIAGESQWEFKRSNSELNASNFPYFLPLKGARWEC